MGSSLTFSPVQAEDERGEQGRSSEPAGCAAQPPALDSAVGEPGALRQDFVPPPTPGATLLPAVPASLVPTTHQAASLAGRKPAPSCPLAFPFLAPHSLEWALREYLLSERMSE